MLWISSYSWILVVLVVISSGVCAHRAHFPQRFRVVPTSFVEPRVHSQPHEQSSEQFIVNSTSQSNGVESLKRSWLSILKDTLHPAVYSSDEKNLTTTRLRPNYNGRKRLTMQMTRWWESMTAGRSGLLLILAPTIAAQARLLQSSVPFSIDRILQYIQPLNLALYASLTQSQGIKLLKTVLAASAAVGLVQMAKDSFLSGVKWLPSLPAEDSYALVTGASSGLGKAVAFQLLEQGYNLILVARNATALEAVHNEFVTEQRLSEGEEPATVVVLKEPSNKEETVPVIGPLHRQIETIPLDLSHPLAHCQLLRELKTRGLENKIDVLVANAGRGSYGPFHQAASSDVRDVLSLNVASTVNLVRSLVPRMLFRRYLLQQRDSAAGDTGGRILLISSVAGAGPGGDIALYSAAKAFVTNFAMSIRRELLPEGIMVTVAQPGPLRGTNFNFLAQIDSLTHVPLAFRIPFFVIPTEKAAREIVRAVHLGREVVCPGFFTKLHVHVLSKLLPPSVLSAAVQRMWKPLPSITAGWRRTDQSPMDTQGRTRPMRRIRRSMSDWRQRWQVFWYRPIIDYAAIRQWFEEVTSGNFMVPEENPGTTTGSTTESPVDSYETRMEQFLRASEAYDERDTQRYFNALYAPMLDDGEDGEYVQETGAAVMEQSSQSSVEVEVREESGGQPETD